MQSNMVEEWRVIKKTRNSVWEISNYGNMKRNGNPYYPEIEPYRFRKDGTSTARCRCWLGRIHQLVWRAFVGEIPKGMQIDHIDTDSTNNRLDNLRLVTPKENMNNPLSIEHSSKAKKKENHPMWGKHQSKETIEKRKYHLFGNTYGKANKGRVGPNAGRKRVYNEDGTYKYIKVA